MARRKSTIDVHPALNINAKHLEAFMASITPTVMNTTLQGPRSPRRGSPMILLRNMRFTLKNIGATILKMMCGQYQQSCVVDVVYAEWSAWFLNVNDEIVRRNGAQEIPILPENWQALLTTYLGMSQLEFTVIGTRRVEKDERIRLRTGLSAEMVMTLCISDIGIELEPPMHAELYAQASA